MQDHSWCEIEGQVLCAAGHSYQGGGDVPFASSTHRRDNTQEIPIGLVEIVSPPGHCRF